MSIIDRGPTRPQLEEFFTLCENIYQEDRRPTDRNTAKRKLHVFNNLEVFLKALLATNLLNMLSYAISRYQLEIVDLLIEMTRDVDATDIFGNTALHIVVKLGDNSRIETLIHKGVDIDAINTNDKSALEIAAELGFPQVVGALLRSGADIFGTRGSRQTTHHLIQAFIFNRPVDQRTPRFEEIESMVSEIDHSVRRTVAQID